MKSPTDLQRFRDAMTAGGIPWELGGADGYITLTIAPEFSTKTNSDSDEPRILYFDRKEKFLKQTP
jgi:hypothetical protein